MELEVPRAERLLSVQVLAERCAHLARGRMVGGENTNAGVRVREGSPA